MVVYEGSEVEDFVCGNQFSFRVFEEQVSLCILFVEEIFSWGLAGGRCSVGISEVVYGGMTTTAQASDRSIPAVSDEGRIITKVLGG